MTRGQSGNHKTKEEFTFGGCSKWGGIRAGSWGPGKISSCS